MKHNSKNKHACESLQKYVRIKQIKKKKNRTEGHKCGLTQSEGNRGVHRIRRSRGLTDQRRLDCKAEVAPTGGGCSHNAT